MYQLTSPLMQDKKANGPIHQLQNMLAGHNHFKLNFRPGAIDGAYGPATASAVKRAKYRLGFPKVTGQAGNTFLSILSGTQAWPRAYQIIAWKRRKAGEATKTLRDRAFDKAMSQKGVKESPAGTNHVLFNDWYYGKDVRGPWCCTFATWCYVQAGSKALAKGSRYAYVPYLLHDAQSDKYGLSVTTEPVHGDLVLYDWDGDGVADHVGLYDKWNTPQHNPFSACEGNTDKGNNSNGGQVQYRDDRVKSEVIAFIRVSQ